MRLSSSFKVDQYGRYRFDWRNEGQPVSAAELTVDGFPVSANEPITLESGLHTIVATNTVQSNAGVARLLWAPQDSQMGPLPTYNLDPRKIQPRDSLRFPYSPRHHLRWTAHHRAHDL